MDVDAASGDVEYGAPDWGMPPWVDGCVLPSSTHIAGRNVALLDAGEYRALLALAEAASDSERVREARAAVAAEVEEAGPGIAQPATLTRISDVEVVTLPREHYAELLDCRRLIAETGIEKWQYHGEARPSTYQGTLVSSE